MSHVRAIAIHSADRLVAKGCHDAAASILEKYVKVHGECPQVLRRLGRIRLAMQQPQAAAESLQRALDIQRARDTADTGIQPGLA
ncbi:MAG: hypothetical protein AAF610_05080 [Pseudomonadota bacterium]